MLVNLTAAKGDLVLVGLIVPKCGLVLVNLTAAKCYFPSGIPPAHFDP